MRGLNQQKSLSHSSRGQKSEIKLWAGLVASGDFEGGSVPGLCPGFWWFQQPWHSSGSRRSTASTSVCCHTAFFISVSVSACLCLCLCLSLLYRSVVKHLPANAGDVGSIPGSGRFPWRRKGQPTPVFLPGESCGQRSLLGYSPWGHKRVRHE